MSLRRGRVLGRLGRDPQLNTTGDGTSVTSASVATEEYHDDETVWVNLVAFGQSAEFLAEYGQKGDHVYAEGRVQLDEWTGDDGQTRTNLELVATEVQLPKSKGGGGGQSGQNTPPPTEAPNDSFSSDEVPF